MPSGFSAELARLAQVELARYGGMPATRSPLRERIAEYWRFLAHPELQGVAWSAAFISYMAHLAGAGQRFHYTLRHSDYIYRAIQARSADAPDTFVGLRADESAIEPGDILGMNRYDAPPIDYDWAARHERYKSHCDIVVSTAADEIVTVGGNVGDPPGFVGIKTYAWREGVLLNPLRPNQRVFVVIRHQSGSE